MSALSISSVAASGSSAQAPAQPGAADAVADTSPFTLLLAALTAADPDLQSALQSNATPTQSQPDASQAPTAPARDGQASGTPAVRLFAVPDNDAGATTDIAVTDVADTGADPTANAAQTSVTDPGDVTAPKSGKPDKKATTDKPGADDTANALPVQVSVMPQPPIPPMAQAAVQTQTVASNDDDGDIPTTGAIGARSAAPTLPAQSGAVSSNKPMAPGPSASQPISSQPSQPGVKQVAAQPVTQPPPPANDDDTDDDEDLNNTIAALQTKAGAHAGGTKSTQLHNPPSKPASQAAAQPQAPAAADDADADIEPAAAQSSASTPSQTTAQTPQPTVDNAATGNTAAVFTAQQMPQKPAAAAKPAPDKVADAALPPATTNTNVIASANDPAQSAAPAPAPTADNNSDSKPAHAATSTAPQPQPDTPPSAQHPAAAAMPQATVAINAAGTPSQNVPTLSVHVAIHTSDSQSAAPSTVTPNADALAISVAARSLSGSKQFDIRLDPPELGRVDVRLSIDASGKTQAHMTTDQPQTLELLQKDAPNLTRALRDAGLDVSQNGLNFSLKGQGQNQGGQGGQFGTPSRSLSLPAVAQSIETAQPTNGPSSLLGNARLDIHV